MQRSDPIILGLATVATIADAIGTAATYAISTATVTVTDADVRDYYDRHKDDYVAPARAFESYVAPGKPPDAQGSAPGPARARASAATGAGAAVAATAPCGGGTGARCGAGRGGSGHGRGVREEDDVGRGGAASSHGRLGRHLASRRNRRASASCARTRLA